MLTKKQFANAIIREFAIKHLRQNIKDIDVAKISEDYAFDSSSLAVAMEFLGMLKSKAVKEYAKQRAGMIFQSYNAETG